MNVATLNADRHSHKKVRIAMPKGKHVKEITKHTLDITTINKGLISDYIDINKINQMQILSFSEHNLIFYH